MKVLLKGGTDSAIIGYSGLQGELVVKSSSRDIRAMDGVTPGGFPLSGIPPTYRVEMPNIDKPISGDLMSPLKLIFATSPYIGDGGHLSTTWEIATDVGFTSLTYSNTSTNYLTHLYIDNVNGELLSNTGYYIRARHTSTIAGNSAWSPTSTFTTTDGMSLLPIHEIVAFDSSPDDHFGSAIAMTEDYKTLFISSDNSPTYAGVSSGKIYEYVRVDGEWVFKQFIYPEISAANAHFGTGLAISPDGLTLAVGSYMTQDLYGNSYTGKVTLFKRDVLTGEWSESGYLFSSNVDFPSTSSSFGFSIEISSDGLMLAVSAHTEGVSQSTATPLYSGVVYIYAKDGIGNWSEVQRIIPTNKQSGQHFGSSIAISADKTIGFIGSRLWDKAVSNNVGKVYKYNINPLGVWVEVGEIFSPNPVDGFTFGSSLSLKGNDLYIGECRGSLYGDIYGIVHHFTITQLNDIWYPIDKLMAYDAKIDDRYGAALAHSLGGKILAIGNYLYDDAVKGSNVGKVYIYG